MEMNEETKTSIRYCLDLYGPDEARFALRALEKGKVDGSTFMGKDGCGCLLGTLETKRILNTDPELSDTFQLIYDIKCGAIGNSKKVVVPHDNDIMWSGDTGPAEFWFTRILPGMTPKKDSYARQAYDVIKEWLDEQTNVAVVEEATTEAVAYE